MSNDWKLKVMEKFKRKAWRREIFENINVNWLKKDLGASIYDVTSTANMFKDFVVWSIICDSSEVFSGFFFDQS